MSYMESLNGAGGSICISSVKGFAKLDPRAAAWASMCRWRRPESSSCGSAAVVVADVSSVFKVPSWSTSSSKLLALGLAGCLDLRLSSNILPRSRISCRALRRRSTASESSDSRVDASGEASLDSEGGATSSPRLCKAMATFLLDSSIHWRT